MKNKPLTNEQLSKHVAEINRMLTMFTEKQVVMRMVLRSLISTHPNRAAAKAIFQFLTPSEWKQDLSDFGFERRIFPDIVRNTGEHVERELQFWLGEFD